MRTRVIFAVVLGLLASAALLPAQSGVGLGLFGGMTLPHGETTDIPSSNWEPAFNWGFFVDIPLVQAFHIATSSELYTLGSDAATDMALSFKFIVPLSSFDLYAGVVSGLTAVGDTIAPHVGVLVGGAWILVSNLDAFVQGKYNVVLDGSENIRVLHVNAGVIFRF